MSFYSSRHTAGVTLSELMIGVVILGILLAIGYPSYMRYIRQTHLSEAQQALLDNAQAWERYYANHGNFRKTSRQWADLLIEQTEHFCIRPQGAPRGTLGDGQYALKAVSLDKNREPRVLIINQDLSLLLCETSTSTCAEKPFFNNPQRADSNCRAYP